MAIKLPRSPASFSTFPVLSRTRPTRRTNFRLILLFVVAVAATLLLVSSVYYDDGLFIGIYVHHEEKILVDPNGAALEKLVGEKVIQPINESTVSAPIPPTAPSRNISRHFRGNVLMLVHLTLTEPMNRQLRSFKEIRNFIRLSWNDESNHLSFPSTRTFPS